MTDIELVLRKLAILQDHLQRARRRRPETIEALAADQDLQAYASGQAGRSGHVAARA